MSLLLKREKLRTSQKFRLPEREELQEYQLRLEINNLKTEKTFLYIIRLRTHVSRCHS
jgi:hypothetical protein